MIDLIQAIIQAGEYIAALLFPKGLPSVVEIGIPDPKGWKKNGIIPWVRLLQRACRLAGGKKQKKREEMDKSGKNRNVSSKIQKKMKKF